MGRIFCAPKKHCIFARKVMNLAVLPPKTAGVSPSDLLSRLRHYQMMPQLLRGVVIDRAIAPFFCTAQETELALIQFYQQHQLDSSEAVETWLRLNHLASKEMEAIALRPVLLEKFKTATWGSKLKSYFLKRKASLDRVVYSLIRTQDRGLAQELHYRLQDNEQSFAELARQFSEGDEKHTGGRIGPVPLSQPHPAIRHLLVVSQAGQFWSPRRIDEWFAIVRLDRLAPVQLNAAIEQYLLDELFEAWVQAEAAGQSQSVLQSLDLLNFEEELVA
jgi:parvulin-like peptidyl-prolyl isomerase